MSDTAAQPSTEDTDAADETSTVEPEAAQTDHPTGEAQAAENAETESPA